MRNALHLAAGLGFALSGCSLGAFQPEGRPCPCADGYVCDEARNVCVTTIDMPRDAGPFSSMTMPRDGGVDGSVFQLSRDGGVVRDSGPFASPDDAGGDPIDGGVDVDAGGEPRDGGDEEPRDGGEQPRDGGVIPRDGGTPDAGPCVLDTDCGDPLLICEGGQCIARCDAPGAFACPTGDVCNPTNGRCTAAVAFGDTCADDWQCETGICAQTNFTGGAQSFCTTLCGRTSECPSSFSCLEVNELRHCLPNTAFNPAPTFATPTPGMCTNGNTCQSGTCNNQTQQCVERCSSTADCNGFGGNCWVYNQTNGNSTQLCYVPPNATTLPRQACAADGECVTNVCHRDLGTCGAPCCTTTDCAPNEACLPYQLDANDVVKLCRPITTTGQNTYFTPCQTNGDCLSGNCVPADASNPTGPKVCSTTCCRDSDCSAIVADATCTRSPGPITGSEIGVCRR